MSGAPLERAPAGTDASEIARYQPRRQPWWRPGRGDTGTFIWMIIIHLGALAALVVAPLPGWRIALGALALHFLGGLGTTVAFHRAIAHKSVKLHPAVQGALTFFAMINGSGAPLSWAAYHRLHHAKSDTPEDISSPGVGGFWWSHLRWIWQAGGPPISRYCRDIDTPSYRFWQRMQVPLALVGLLIGAPFGLAALLWLGPLRITFALHAQCFVNSVCHMRPDRRPEGTARNVVWLSLLHCFQGENWHQNHHDRPGSARLGWTAPQLDVGWYTILLLERLGLAKDVRRPSFDRSSLDVAA